MHLSPSIKLALLAIAAPATVWAQPELPQPSPAAKVSQQVGVTDIAVEYSSPAVRGRKIWGELVPYNEMWRTGANAPTTITFSRDVQVAGKKVPAGTYRLTTIPTAKSWTLIINSDLSGGGQDHNPKADVAKVKLTPTSTASSRERMLFFFNNTTDNSTELTLEWEKLALVIPIQTDTKTFAEQNITQALAQAWRPHFNAARYYVGQGDKKKALELYDASIAIERNWWNTWFKAQLLAEQGQKKEARALAAEAKKMGKNDPIYQRAFSKSVETALKDWSR